MADGGLSPKTLDVLVGLHLSIVRRAADMLVLHFGEVRPHRSGKGRVGDFALHIQCPWRIDMRERIVTGRDDLWEYGGPGEQPQDWCYSDGSSLQDKKLDNLFGERLEGSWFVNPGQFIVTTLHRNANGDVRIEFSDGHSIDVFPVSGEVEAWRFFASADNLHFVFPCNQS